MLVLTQLANVELNIELVPTISVPYWYFQWTLNDLNGNVVELYLVASLSGERYYTFTMNTTANPMKTGEWTLKVFELANNDPSPDVSALTPNYISKARIYKIIPADTYNTISLTDERID